jgi:predicted acyl esterase
MQFLRRGPAIFQYLRPSGRGGVGGRKEGRKEDVKEQTTGENAKVAMTFRIAPEVKKRIQEKADGSIVNLTFDLLPTSWVFKEGHSIRLSIACADWPVFEILPELSPTKNPTDPNHTIPLIRVYRNEVYPSNITLPIIPR